MLYCKRNTAREAVTFFFFFVHDNIDSIIQRMDNRRYEIEEQYGVSLSIPVIELSTMHAMDYYEYCCCDLLEDPEFFLYDERDGTILPETIEEYNRITNRLHNEMRKRCTGAEIGERLRKARKECGLTGEKVVELWSKQLDENGHHCTTTQATVSNHERGKVGSIKLIDLLRYSVIYNIYDKVTTPDIIMFGCTYIELLNNETSIKARTADNPLKEERVLTGDQYIDQLRKLLIVLTEGKCERCDQPAPFYDKTGVPYLLPKMFSNEDNELIGPSFENMVVLCPNCLSRIETLQESEEIERLKKKAASHSVADLYKHATIIG